MLVHLDDSWQAAQRRRAQSGAYAPAVSALLGEMTAAAVLLRHNIKFNGALVLQVLGDGPVKLAVAEVQADLSFRATAKVVGSVNTDATLSDLINVNAQGRCAITLDPPTGQSGQQPYQGVVSLLDAQQQKLPRMSDVLEHYMRQSEQLETRLVLAANEHRAAGVLIQRLPISGQGNLAGRTGADAEPDAPGDNEDYNRIALLAASLKPDELLSWDADTLLHRLFWQEPLQRLLPAGARWQPRFVCTCSRQRVAGMLQGLGQAEVQSIVAEQGRIEVACDFCGAQEVFDAVDAAQLFVQPNQRAPAPPLTSQQ